MQAPTYTFNEYVKHAKNVVLSPDVTASILASDGTARPTDSQHRPLTPTSRSRRAIEFEQAALPLTGTADDAAAVPPLPSNGRYAVHGKRRGVQRGLQQ